MKKEQEQVVITVPEGRIRDYINGVFRKETPEEIVRQNIEKQLVMENNYPANIIQIELPIKVGSSTKRVDIAIYPKGCTKFEQQNINIIVECKAESIPPDDKKDGVGQLKAYMAACSNCDWGMWTNGKDRFTYRKILNEKKAYEFIDYIDIPSFNTNIDEIDRPTRDNQKLAVGDNLLYAFKNCHNIIATYEGMQKQPAFFELLKLIFCKIEDEKNITEDPQFYVTSKEKNDPKGRDVAKKRISAIFTRVKKKFPTIFDKNDELQFTDNRTISHVVAEIQKYSLLDTKVDVKGKAYEEIVGSNLRGDRGEFFTPRNVMRMAVRMINPTKKEKVLDSSCGTGGFLVNAMLHVMEQMKIDAEKQFGLPEKKWKAHHKEKFRDQIREVAGKNFFGFDINPALVKATKMNMVMNNDGSGNILRENSLLSPHEWNTDFRQSLATAFDKDVSAISSYKDIGLFDVIVTNPPFGTKLPVKGHDILGQYDLGRNSTSVPPEQLFVERCVQLLKPGGRLAMIVPDSILGSPGLLHIRKWLIKHTRIIASIDLHVDTFQPKNGTQTSLIIVQKKFSEEINEQQHNYNIFMCMVDKVGHDKRGNDLFKRDKHGEIRYFAKTKINEDGNLEEYAEPEYDDQTELVPDVFKNWKKEEGILW